MDETQVPIASAPLIDATKYTAPEYLPFRAVTFPRDDADWPRIESLKGELDVLTVDIIEWALESAIEESEAAVERTSRSTIIREQHDYRASLNTVDCNSITHVSWAATADPIRVHFALEAMRPGDVYLYNDVYEAYGTIGHLPDYCIVVPIFGHGRVIAFAQVFGHCNDVGGRIAGSWPVSSRTIFEEGLLCPPIRLYAAGVLNEDAYKIVLRNSRFPEELRGDIDAFIGGGRIIERRVLELCDRYGVDVVEAAFYRIMDRCEEMVRDIALPRIPDGDFVGEDFVEYDGIHLHEPKKIQVLLRKDAHKIIVDFAGTDPQAEGPINWPGDGRHYAKWLCGLIKAQVPGMIVNEGALRVFQAYLPPRTLLSPEYPAPVVDRMMCMLRMISAFTIAMTKAFDGEMMADMQGIGMFGMYGHDLDGEFFLYREIFGSGTGARWYADGEDTVDYVPNSRNLPAEFIEQRYPIVVEQVGLCPDSGGAGQYRGGLGYLKDIRALVDGYFLTDVERTAFAPFGLNGGQAGMPGSLRINPGTDDEQHIQFKHESIPVKAGDVVRIITGGGGGWGDPLVRDVEAVRLDAARRVVSVECAAADYGVVLNAASDPSRIYEVDGPATERRRGEIAAARGQLKLINRGEYADAMIAAGKIEVSDFEAPAFANREGTE